MKVSESRERLEMEKRLMIVSDDMNEMNPYGIPSGSPIGLASRNQLLSQQ